MSTVHGLGGDVACCHFLEYGECSHGEYCRYNHYQGDKATTTCSYGMNCPYGHGFERRHEGRAPQLAEAQYEESDTAKGPVCGHFLQEGECSHGDECGFQHVRCDPESTECGYGNQCKYWHGWKQKFSNTQDSTQDNRQWHGWASENYNAKQKKWQPKNSPSDAGGRAERNTWSCSKGDECWHDWGDKSTTTCGVPWSRYDHGWASKGSNKASAYENKSGDWWGAHEPGAKKWGANAPNKLMRAALNSLLGNWNSKDSMDNTFNHEIAYSGSELSCHTWGPGGAAATCKPVKQIRGDIVLGKSGELFLDVSTDRSLVWTNAGHTDEKHTWSKGWKKQVNTSDQGETDACPDNRQVARHFDFQ